MQLFFAISAHCTKGIPFFLASHPHRESQILFAEEWVWYETVAY